MTRKTGVDPDHTTQDTLLLSLPSTKKRMYSTFVPEFDTHIGDVALRFVIDFT